MISSSFFVYPSPGAVSRWRCGRVVFGRRLLLSQSFVFDRWLSLKMNFQPSSVKPKQSMIVIASLRSAQTCCDRSTHSKIIWVGAMVTLRVFIYSNKLARINDEPLIARNRHLLRLSQCHLGQAGFVRMTHLEYNLRSYHLHTCLRTLM